MLAAMAPVPPTARVELLTTAPVTVGLGALVETAPRLRVGTSLGVLPGPYVDAVNAAITLLEPSWTADERQLVEDTVSTSVVWQTNVGWRPVSGLVVQADAHVVALGGRSTTATLVRALTDAEIPAEAEGTPLDATATLGLLGAEVGWDQPLGRALHLRTGLGWSFTVASATRIGADADRPAVDAILDRAGEAGAAYLDTQLRRYAHPPTLTVALGWAAPLARRPPRESP